MALGLAAERDPGLAEAMGSQLKTTGEMLTVRRPPSSSMSYDAISGTHWYRDDGLAITIRDGRAAIEIRASARTIEAALEKARLAYQRIDKVRLPKASVP